MMTMMSFVAGFYRFFTGKFCYWVVRKYGNYTLAFLKNINAVNIHFNSKTDSIDKPLLIISNHISALDTFLLPTYFKNNNLTYVVKRSLIEWKSFPFNIGCKAMGAIAVSRQSNSGDLHVMQEQIIKKIEDNTSVVLFPAGTRSTVIEESINIPPTGALIAKKLKLDILPVFMGTNTWGNGRILKDFGIIKKKDIYVYIGTPISVTADKSTKEIHKEITTFLEQSLQDFNSKS